MDDRDFVLRRQARDDVRANESGAADDDNPHSLDHRISWQAAFGDLGRPLRQEAPT
jgi:hypothetical protein